MFKVVKSKKNTGYCKKIGETEYYYLTEDDFNKYNYELAKCIIYNKAKEEMETEKYFSLDDENNEKKYSLQDYMTSVMNDFMQMIMVENLETKDGTIDIAQKTQLIYEFSEKLVQYMSLQEQEEEKDEKLTEEMFETFFGNKSKSTSKYAETGIKYVTRKDILAALDAVIKQMDNRMRTQESIDEIKEIER